MILTVYIKVGSVFETGGKIIKPAGNRVRINRAIVKAAAFKTALITVPAPPGKDRLPDG